MKVHHSVTDGVGGMALLAHLVDLDARRRPSRRRRLPAAPAPEPIGALDARCATRSRTRRAARSASRAASRARAARRDRDACAIRSARGVDLVRTARSIGRTLAPATVADVAGDARPRPRPPPRHVRRRRSTTCSAPRRPTEGSVNDVFVAAVVGGVRRYHERHGDCARRAAHDAADQPAPGRRRRRRQPLRAGAVPGAARRSTIRASACRRSARSCAAGGPSPRCR